MMWMVEEWMLWATGLLILAAHVVGYAIGRADEANDHLVERGRARHD